MEKNFNKFITGLQHIGIPTNDIEVTTAFYKTLGFDVAFQTINKEADEKVAFLRMQDIVIETYENKKAALVNGAIDHIALNVTDIEAVFELAKENEFCILDEEIQFLPFWENGVRFLQL